MLYTHKAGPCCEARGSEVSKNDRLIAFRANDEDLRLIDAVRRREGLANSSETIRYSLRLAASGRRSGQQQGEEQVSAVLQSSNELSLARLTEAFERVIRPERTEPFGSEALGLRGFSDGNPGVQWNAWTGTHPGLGDEDAAYLGVNLEGLKYGNYPIADLLIQETQRPLVFKAIEDVKHPERIRVVWWIDAWQGGGRLPNFPEHQITDEVPLNELTKNEWARATRTALACLDADRVYRGRGRRVITLRSGEEREYAVSPHVQFRTIVWTTVPPLDQAIEQLREAKVLLEPLYEFVAAATHESEGSAGASDDGANVPMMGVATRRRNTSVQGAVISAWEQKGRPRWDLRQTIGVVESIDETLEREGLNPAPRFRAERTSGNRSYVQTWVLGCHFPWLNPRT